MFSFGNIISLIGNGTANFVASFFSILYSLFGKHIVNFFLWAFSALWNLIVTYIWWIVKFVLAVIDAMQFGATKLLGIDTTTSTSFSLGTFIDGLKDISFKNTNYYDMLLSIFKATAGVAILLMIIFTIIAMVMQEVKLASTDDKKANNEKGKFLKLLLSNFLTIMAIPLLFYTIIIGTNSILTSFYRAIGQDSDVTIAGQVLASSTYDANRYRSYANANKRIPITISVYDTTNSFGTALSDDELKEAIADEETQNKLKAIAGALANDNFLSFEKSTVYIDGKWENYKNYSLSYNDEEYEDMGQYFENFICTREQYYVLADFVDFCQLHNINYYIKSISESDICWKYVDGLTVGTDIDDDGNALGDITLTINYRDADEVNTPSDVADAADGTSTNHSLTISTKIDMTSPISDALTTASTLLGVDDDSATFYAMERDDSGDSTNLVSWSTEKVFLKLSDGINLTNKSSWTCSDEIIIYEYYHYETNNTLGDYSIDDLKTGITLSAREMTFRNFNYYTQTYSSESTQYCVYLNGNYYRIKQSDTLVNSYGHYYYVLDVLDDSTHYYDSMITITSSGSVSLKLSSSFDINDKSKWTFTDQVLVYEYFKDLSLSNGIRRTNKFSDFDSAGSGVSFNKYSIGGTSYLFINGTYYQCSGSSLSGSSFLVDKTAATTKWFGYQLSVDDRELFGINNLGGLYSSSCSGFSEIDGTNIFYAKYSQTNMKFSEDFSFLNSETWTYRDYALMYIYVKALSADTKTTLETIKSLGLQGTLGRSGSTYYLEMNIVKSDATTSTVYINLNNFEKTSEQKITQTVSAELFNNLGFNTEATGLIMNYTVDSTTKQTLLSQSSSSETHTFVMSDDFDQYDARTWSVGDYFLLYLTKRDIIDVDISWIKQFGYNSLIYKLNDNTYYRFGVLGGITDYFLDGNKLASYDIDKWFSMNLLSYILTTYNATTSDLVFDEDSFAGGILTNPDAYVYDYTSPITSSSSIANKLATEYIANKTYSNDKTSIQYTYFNDEIVEDDITTWTYMDLLIYCETGSVPTQSNPYVSYLTSAGTFFYLVVGEKKAYLGDSRFNCYKGGNFLTNRIMSNTPKSFESSSDFSNYFERYFKVLCSDSTGKTKISNVPYYYHSNALQGTGTATFSEDTVYSAFDLFLIKAGVSLTSDGYYTFISFKDSSDSIYLNLNGTYVKITDDDSAYYYYQSNTITCFSSTRPFTDTNTTYVSFDTSNANYPTKYDAFLYSLTNSIVSVTYTIYKYSTSSDWIKVGDNLIKYDSTLATTKASAYAGVNSCYSMYSNYYKQYVVTTEPSSGTTTYASGNKINDNISLDGFSVSDTSSWTGLHLILYNIKYDLNKGNMTASGSIANFYTDYNCKIKQTTEGEFYLEFRLGDDDYYVYLDDLVTVSLASGSVSLADKSKDRLNWQLYNGIDVYSTQRNADDYYLNLTNLGLTVDSLTYSTITPILGSLNIESFKSWTWENVLFKYFYPNSDSDGVKYCVYFHNSATYCVFTKDDIDYVIPNADFSKQLLNFLTVCTSPIFNASTALGTVCVSKSYNYAGIAYYKLKNVCATEIEIYAFNSNSGKCYFVYDLPNATNTNSSVQYLTIKAKTSGAKTEFVAEAVSSAAGARKFTLEVKSIDSITTWSILDFILNCSGIESFGSFVSSCVYLNNDKYYIKYNDNYLLIPTATSSTYQSVFKADSLTSGQIKCSSNVISLYSNVSCNYYGINGIYEYENPSSSGDLKENKNGEIQLLKFSSGFDVTDYSTWTYSDYLIYYAFSNGYYGDENFSQSFKYTYIPTYTRSGGMYYGLTYLDLVLANFYGTKEGDTYYYNYFEDRKESYSFVLGSDSSGNYYLKLNDSNYACISEDISIDFSDFSIVSKSINSILALDKASSKNDIAEKITNMGEVGGYYKNSVTGQFSQYYTTFSGKNFQTFVNCGGAPIYIFKLLKQNKTTGDSEVEKVISFSNSATGKYGTYFIYDRFYDYYGRQMSSKMETEKVNDLTITIADSAGDIDAELKTTKTYDGVLPDLTFDNYYYFATDAENLLGTGILDIPSTNYQAAIINSTWDSSNIKQLNLKLSTNFSITDISKWTILDYIICYEYSRDVRNNKFKGLDFNSLKTENYIVDVYYYESLIGATPSTYVILYINGNFYNLEIGNGKEVTWNDTLGCYWSDSTRKINASSTIITKGTVNDYDFKVLAENLELYINPNYTSSKQLTRTKDNTSYTIGNYTYFLTIDTNVADTNFRINVADYATYSTKELIQSVSWVEKLMTDMQVYYPDLNWGVLVATDGWLDTLGDFTSAYSTGLYVSDNNSSNTTAAGLVLSEFFMSVATPVSNSYADYEYSSMFDEDTIHALMKSLVGEEDYNGLVLEAQVFMDFFNSCFAPIIDDFAEEFGEDIGNNSLRLCAYKSYLATLLLSSDIGEYLYTIATRVYAEYTIGEYLAASCGDYGNYYLYSNNMEDEEGNTVDSFTYGTFAQLVQYENKFCGNSNPTFSFNMKKAFDKYKDDNNKISGFLYDQITGNDTYYAAVVYEVVDEMISDYKAIYKSNYTINENGKVIDENGALVDSYSEETYVYCYMIHVYSAINQSISNRVTFKPIYLSNFYDYLTNDIRRWDILCDDEIETADQYFENYLIDKGKLTVYKNLYLTSCSNLYIPQLNLEKVEEDFSDDENFMDVVKNCLNVKNNINLPIYGAGKILEKSSVKSDYDYVKENCLKLYISMSYSENSFCGWIDTVRDWIVKTFSVDTSVTACWENIVQFRQSLYNVISELKAARDILDGETTEKGSTRMKTASSYYTDSDIDAIINAFQTVYQNVNQYYLAQTRLDKMTKRSITFTLAQYGANYVAGGYEFSIKNKTYTFHTEVDPSRLAEYVYGGAFLDSVGVGAQYTSSDYTGMVKASKVYDSTDKAVKTKLVAWQELRTFVSEIADTTAELYYMTNLADLDSSKINGIKLSDVTSNGSSESLLYTFIVNRGNLSTELLTRILGSGYTTYTHSKFVAISQYLFSYDYDESIYEDMTLEDYKRIVLKKVIDNDKDSQETAEERAGRYMMLFELLSVQIDYSANGKSLGRIIPVADIVRSGTSVKFKNAVELYSSNNEESVVENYSDLPQYNISASLSSSYNTQETIKALSGIENRPTKEILTREYSSTRTTDYFDEAYGDSFVVCTYQNGLYYPVVGTGSQTYSSTKFNAYNETELLEGNKFITDYYDGSSSYVVMAKGVITADGNPTAIRKYNNAIEIEQKKLLKNTTTVYNAVTFYRTSIGASFEEGEDLIEASRAVSRVTTKNYTKYIYGTSFTKGIGGTTTYTGKTNLQTFVQSDYEVNFIQSTDEYLISQADDYGGISVLDEFSYFYLLGGQSWVLLMLAFITIIPIMVNTLGGAMRRVLDLIVLFISGPLVISTRSLDPDGKNKKGVYKTWKRNLEGTLLCVLGYILGFSAYFILVPIAYNTKIYVSYSTYKRILNIGGFGYLVSYSAVNSFMRCLWVITATAVVKKIPNLLMPIITANNGDLPSAEPPMGKGKTFLEQTQKTKQDIAKSFAKVGSIASGQALMGAVDAVFDDVQNMIPGAKIIKDFAGKLTPKAEEKVIEKALLKASDIGGAGLSKEDAKKAAKAVTDAQAKRKTERDKKKQENMKAARALFS